MEKGVCVNSLILIWTILGCLTGESAAGRGAQWNRNGDPEEKKSISCYQCNSAYDPNCGDPFDPYTIGLVNCSLKPKPEHLGPNITSTICRKNVQKVYGKIRIVRACGYITDERDDKECVKRSGTHDVQVNYCSCTTAECNGGHTLLSSLQMTAAGVLILMALFTTLRGNVIIA
ncbi:uncharacterized protein CBL_03540 [Carabus blaptoides fortunei]